MALTLAVAGQASAGESEAVADAEARLAAVDVPPGAIPVSERPQGITVLGGPPEVSGSPNFVDRGKWWVLAESSSEVLEWFRANPPAGASQRISGGLYGPGGEFSYLGFEWPETSRLAWRMLTVAAATRPEGGSALRIDAQDVWLEQHPASEKIPKAARFLEIVWDRSKGRDSTGSTSNRRFIRSISGELDSLPVAQAVGIVYGCSPLLPTATVTLRFRARRGGPDLATAVQRMPPGPCSPMSMTIGGKRRAALVKAGPVIARLRKLR